MKTYGYALFLEPLVQDIKISQTGRTLPLRIFKELSYSLPVLLKFCNMHRNEMQIRSTADPQQLRSLHGYENDFDLDNYTETGIKSPCALNEIENFHVTTNYAPDIMHNLLEGICKLEVHLTSAQLIRRSI